MTKVLLVEDDKSLREIYGVRLLAEGYDIVSAGDGEEALAMAIKEKPTLIISDVMMPKISGFDMLDILRSTTETRDIKVIMMTALSSDDQRARGEQLGADRYLVKSQVGIEDVVRTVHEVLDGKGAVVAEPKEEKKDDAQKSPVNQSEDVSNSSDEDHSPASAGNESKTESIENTDSSVDTDNTKEESNMSPKGEDTAPTTTNDSSDSVASTPGNEDAGPLPPQPTEMESKLPEPTAPFSSQRPTNLGENVINPSDSVNPVDNSNGAVVPPVVDDAAAPVVPPVDAPVVPPVPEVEVPVVPPVPESPESPAPSEEEPSVVPPVPPAPSV